MVQNQGRQTFSKGGKTVLVIDDTADIRMIITESLNLHGFTTLSANDGHHGIEMAKEHHPDLIICDINMPKLDGYGTLTALREDEVTATIPFIFLSGATDKLNMRRGMELGGRLSDQALHAQRTDGGGQHPACKTSRISTPLGKETG